MMLIKTFGTGRGRLDAGPAWQIDSRMLHSMLYFRVKKVLPATCTCLTQAGVRASNTFCHPRLGRKTKRKN